jgi:hypothetical protein
VRDEPRANGVLPHVVDRRRVLLVVLDRSRRVAAAEEVVLAAVTLIEGGRVAAVQVAHPLREVGLRSHDDEVVVVVHEAPGLYAPPVAARDPEEDVEEDAAVVILGIDRPPVVPACRQVVDAAGRDGAERSCHTGDGSGAEARFQPPRVIRHASDTSS